jgi:hypothetical protein
MLLSSRQRRPLTAALSGRLLAVSFGSGVDSTAMLVALKLAGLRPGEKPETLDHIDRMNAVLTDWSWPAIVVCRKIPLASTGYADLYGNCIVNETLPSLAFGMKSCSIKWKQKPQDQVLKGAKSGPNASPPHPVWIEAQRTGQRIVKLIGYDCGRADLRRSSNLPDSDADFDYVYPLQLLGTPRLRSRDHRDPRRRHGSHQVGVLLLPGIEAMGTLLARGAPSRSPRARVAPRAERTHRPT